MYTGGLQKKKKPPLSDSHVKMVLLSLIWLLCNPGNIPGVEMFVHDLAEGQSKHKKTI